MKLCKLLVRTLPIALIVLWAFSQPCLAQRSGRGGGGGGKSGGGSSSHSDGSHSGSSGVQHDAISSSNQHGDNDQHANQSHGDSDHGERHEAFFRGSSDQSIDDRDTGDRQSSVTKNHNGAMRDNRRNNHDNFSASAERTRDDWSHRDRDKLPFRDGWWNSFARDRWPGYGPWGYSNYRDRPYYWWGYTAAGPLSNWFGFGWDRPRYWGYGPGANIYYQDDYVYYDGDRYLPVNDYYQRMYNLAHSVPEISQSEAEKMEWMPLGVFAVTRGGDANQRDEGDQRSIQLAVNKEGVISGTFYNDKNNQAHPVTGMVDKRNQRAAWAFADGDHPKLVFETSVFNLTKPESSMMVHYGPNSDDTEVWHLVRLEQPESGNSNANAQPQPAGNDLP